MKKVNTILLLLLLNLFTSSLVYSQSNQVTKDITSPNIITVKSYAFSKGSFILGTNLSYAYSNENFDAIGNSSSFNSQAYGLNLNAGYMATNYTKVAINFDRNFYHYDTKTTKNNNYSYGLSVSQYLLSDRFTPFIKLSSSLINGKRNDNYINVTEVPYKGYNIIFSAGIIYYIVNNFYIQGDINLISYQNLDYIVDNGIGTNSIVNNQQFLLGLSQPISIGIFYNLKK